MRKFPLLLSLLLVLAGCQDKDDGKTRAAIDARNHEFGAAFAKGDAAALAALYTADAVLMPPNAPVVTGHDAIQKLWQGFIESGAKGAQLTSTEVEGRGDHADEEGQYTVLGADGKTLDTGKYIVIWKRENGSWFLHRDIWNSNAPAPAPAAAAPAMPPTAETAPAPTAPPPKP